MPFYTDYDWIEIYSYDQDTKEFVLEFRDDFEGEDYSPLNWRSWSVSNGWGYKTTTWCKDHAYIYNGAARLVIDNVACGERSAQQNLVQ